MKDYLDTYINSLIIDNELELNQEIVIKSKRHFNELDFLIRWLINSYLFILNFLSICINFKPLAKVENNKIRRLKNILFIFGFLINKIDQVLFVIISIQSFGKEEINLLSEGNISNSDSTNYSRFIVLGSGPSGAVTALELEKKYPGEVLLLEKGCHHSIPDSKHPGDEFIKKWYRGGINSTYFFDMIAYTSGTCFGGGSEINSGLYHEPDKDFLLKWKNEFDTKDLTISSLKTHIKKVNSLTTKKIDQKTLFSEKFKQGTVNSSHKYTFLPRFLNSLGNRNSMSETLLKDYLEREGKLKLGEEIEKIFYRNDKWFLRPTNKKKFYSCEKLFICCGSVFTNNLLLKSKIIKRNKNVLKKFKFHPMVKVIASYKEELQKLNDDVTPDQNIEFYPNFIIGNASSSIQFLISSFQRNEEIKKFIMKNWKKMKVFHATFSLGMGRIYSIPFLKDPILTYHLSRLEKKNIYEGLIEMIKFIKETKASTLIPVKNRTSLVEGNGKYELVTPIIKNIKGFQLSSVHILGGVTMGENKNCIVNSYGKVFDAEGLYINDSSLINTPLLKNPQGTVMSIAYRNIDNFINTYELH